MVDEASLGRWLLVSIVAILFGCSNAVSFSGTGGQGASGHGGSTSTSTSSAGDCNASCESCNACADADACHAARKQCDGDPECLTIEKCVEKVHDVVACGNTAGSGAVTYAALAACECETCAASCNTCKLVHCIDHVQNHGEEKIDCGGSCPACTGSCTDGIKNNGEEGVDCGVACSNVCPGSPCSASTLCAGSGICVDGVCCNSACTGLCTACTKAKKGSGDDGTCGPIAAGTDPDSECTAPAGDTCNGAGACQCHDGMKDGGETSADCGGPICQACGGTCTDGVKNGTETAIDCGGITCPKCSNGKTCSRNLDCMSGNCAANGLCEAACVPMNPCAGKCGTVTNNCGTPTACPGCTSPDTCNTTTHLCVCTPETELEACGAQCALTAPNGCGGTVNCNTSCTGTDVCNMATGQCQPCMAANPCNPGDCDIMKTDACGVVHTCADPCSRGMGGVCNTCSQGGVCNPSTHYCNCGTCM